MNYNYIIFCHPRTGSHMLCTLLNSHPDVACYGEQGELLEELLNSTGKIKGRIVFYHERYTAKPGQKIIHLVRNPRDIAISKYVFCNTTERPRHSFKEKEVKIKMDGNEDKRETKRIEELIERMKSVLIGTDFLEISYEELTNNKNVKMLNEKSTNKILNFLKVERKELTTNLVKPNTTLL